MGFQTCVLQQFRISTPGLTVADRGARCTCNSSWVRANSDAVPSTTQILREKFTPIRNRGRRNGVVDGIQGFGLGSGLYDGVRIANKWKLRPREGRQSRNVGVVRASMKLDPGGGGPGEENGIGRVVVNLAIAGGLTYLTITGKLSWLFDALVSLWLFVVLVPIVGFIAFLWFADREIISSTCPNCGNPFQVLEFTMKEEEEQFCPYCSQPFKLEGKQFVRDGPRFSKKQSKGFRQPFGQPGFGGPFGGSGQRQTSGPSSPSDSPGVIVDVEAEVVDQD
ncbi:hypothetical protein M758_10G055700 [Ceratodon purpureus]|nr:hypothetical protein M758_10G055700 [Ceratodon purpureus]